MKLSELADKLGIPVESLLEQLEIDGSGKFSDLAAQAGRAATLETTLQQRAQELANYQLALQQYQQQQQQQQQRPQQPGAYAWKKPEWADDVLLNPLLPELESMARQIEAFQTQMAKFQEIERINQINEQRWQQAIQWANEKIEPWRMKSKYEDFDAEAVTKYLEDNKLGNLNWDEAYERHRASRVPDLIKQAAEKAREEGRKEAVNKGPIPSEMGGAGALSAAPNRPGSPGGWDAAFDKMRNTLDRTLMGGNA